MMGRIVYTETGSINNGRLQKTVSVPSSVSNGIYIVRIILNDKVYFAKLIYAK